MIETDEYKNYIHSNWIDFERGIYSPATKREKCYQTMRSLAHHIQQRGQFWPGTSTSSTQV